MTSTPGTSNAEETRTLGSECDRLCDAFEAAWKSGTRPRIEEFVARAGTVASPALVRELLLVEQRYRTAAGEMVRASDYRSRLAPYAALVDEVLAGRPSTAAAPAPPPTKGVSAAPPADEHLLLGLLACQLGFIRREQLLAALRTWCQDKSRSLGGILEAQQALSYDRLLLLSALVKEHLRQHGDDPRRSLEALSSIESLRAELHGVGDADVQDSLSHVAAQRHAPDETRLPGADAAPQTSSSIRYRVLQFYKQGGLGAVYRAQDLELNRVVALKQIQDQRADDPEARQRFLREAEITGALEHPSIVPVYGLGTYASGRPYYAMRFIEGQSLADAIARYHDPANPSRRDPSERTLELRRLLQRFIDVCEAMAFAHERNVLHRDLKPGNVMLGKYGETLVIDWGLAKDLKSEAREVADGPWPSPGYFLQQDSDATPFGVALGTLAYMSPEQAAGQIGELSRASDIYSLGATLFHLLVGRAPISRDEAAQQEFSVLIARIVEGRLPAPRDLDRHVPRPLDAICRRAMAQRPDARYASAKELADDLERWLADEPVRAWREPWSARLERWSRRHRQLVQATAAAVLVVSVVGSLAAWQVARARRAQLELVHLNSQVLSFENDLLTRPPRDVDSFDRLWRDVDTIAGQSEELARPKRQALAEQFLAHGRALLERPRFAESDEAEFDRCLARLRAAAPALGPEFAARLDALDAARQQRLAVWDPLHTLAAPIAPADVRAVFPPAAVGTDGVRLTRTAPVTEDDDRLIATLVACPAEALEVSATFDPSWSRASLLGLALHVTDEHRYEFVLAVPGFDPRDRSARDLARLPSAHEVLSGRGERRLVMHVLRDGQPLRSTSLAVTEGPLRIQARREGMQLGLTINDEASVVVDDPFPLPPSIQGKFAVLWPEGVPLERFAVRRKRVSQAAGPLELADQALAANRLAEALAAYERVPEGDSILAAEARYKRAVCLGRLARSDEARELLEALWNEQADRRPEARRWRALAGMRLLEDAWQRDDDIRSRALLIDLSTVFSLAEIAQFVPAEHRNRLLQQIRREGQRWRLAFDRAGDIEAMEQVAALDTSLNEDPLQRCSTWWRLADAYRCSDRGGDALVVLRRLLSLPVGPPPADRARAAAAYDAPLGLALGQSPAYQVTLVRDLLWLHLERNELDAAQAVLDAWLPVGDAAPSPERMPLWVDRARLAWRREQHEEAEAWLKRFLAEVDPRRVAHGQLADACLLYGLLLERKGDARAAREVWFRGARRNWHEGFLESTELSRASGAEMVEVALSLGFDGMLAGLTGEYPLDEAARALTNHLGGSGVTTKVIERLAPTAFPPEFVRDATLAAYRSPRGRAFIRRSALQEVTLREQAVEPAYLLVWGAARVACFGGLPPEQPSALDELLYTDVQYMVDGLDSGEFDVKFMETVLNLWRGRFDEPEWRRQTARHPAKWPTLAYVIARRYHTSPELADDRRDRRLLDRARWLYEEILRNPDSPPVLHSLAEEGLAGLPAPPPKSP